MFDSVEELLKGRPELAKLNPGLVAEAKPETKANKYHAVKTSYRGRVFASKHEAQVAADYDLMIKAGELLQVFYQVRFPLPGGVVYVADFVLIWADWHVSVVDAKGKRTREYINKKKQFEERYAPMKITEV
jgi:hypothetical protein